MANLSLADMSRVYRRKMSVDIEIVGRELYRTNDSERSWIIAGAGTNGSDINLSDELELLRMEQCGSEQLIRVTIHMEGHPEA